MRKRRNTVFAAVCTVYLLSAVTMAAGCASPDEAKDGGAAESFGDIENQTGEEDEKAASKQPAPEEKKRLLEMMTGAIEGQFREEVFSDIPDSEIAAAIERFQEDYIFSGRKSATGKVYIAGVSVRDENPVAGMSCSYDGSPSEYVVSQFDNGGFLLMEKSGQDGGGFSELYDVLQTGESGLQYMLDTARRGTTLIMPEETPFLRVYMVKERIPVTEYIPVTREEYTALMEGEPVKLADGAAGTLLLCETKEDVQTLWDGSGLPVSEAMIELARERCGYSADMPGEASFIKASLEVRMHGETREETLGNREDVEELEKILQKITPQSEFRYPSGNYEGILTLTGQEGTVRTLHIGLEGEGCVFGTSLFASLRDEDREALWKQFSTIDGWNRYGDKIGIRISREAYTEEDPAITFILENETGKSINYILSPIFYKKEGESWVMLESIAGFCGVSDGLDGEKLELSVPWNGAFETKGEGLYKLEIQVAPEEGVRFAISDTFVIKNSLH